MADFFPDFDPLVENEFNPFEGGETLDPYNEETPYEGDFEDMDLDVDRADEDYIKGQLESYGVDSNIGKPENFPEGLPDYIKDEVKERSYKSNVDTQKELKTRMKTLRGKYLEAQRAGDTMAEKAYLQAWENSAARLDEAEYEATIISDIKTEGQFRKWARKVFSGVTLKGVLAVGGFITVMVLLGKKGIRDIAQGVRYLAGAAKEVLRDIPIIAGAVTSLLSGAAGGVSWLSKNFWIVIAIVAVIVARKFGYI